MTDSPFDLCASIAPYLPADDIAVGVAVSGGPDSVALCHALSSCARGPVHALTVDHGLRAEAAAEAAGVGRLVTGWPHVTHSVLTRQVGADAGGARILEAARRDRYALMADYCAAHGIRVLFVAHHQDDQAETLLFRLAKGSGLDGLAGMQPVHAYSETLSVIRPFLLIPKTALIAYCKQHGLKFVNDPTNENTDYARPRLRAAQEILEKEGLSAKRLAVTARRLSRARDALDHYAKESFKSNLLDQNPGRFVFNLWGLKQAPAETRLRVILMAAEQLSPENEYGPRREKMENLVADLFADVPFRRRSLGGLLFGRDDAKGEIHIEKEGSNPI